MRAFSSPALSSLSFLSPSDGSNVESIRVIVSMGGKGPVGSGLKSTGGRRSELTEARARIRTITTPVPQLRLREKRARRTLMKRRDRKSVV